MVRELVKWDYELRDGVQVAAVVDRAIDIAMTRRAARYTCRCRGRYSPATPPVPCLPAATRSPPTPPQARTRSTGWRTCWRARASPSSSHRRRGSTPGAADLLGQLCDEYSIGVLESRPRCYNVSTSHPLHSATTCARSSADADVLCFLDVDVPWIPAAAMPRADATIVAVRPRPAVLPLPDPHAPQRPVGHRERRQPARGTRRGPARAKRPASTERRARRDRARPPRRAAPAAATSWPRLASADGPITKTFMNWALAQVLPPDASVVSEYWIRPELQRAPWPAQLVRHPAGGRPWMGPARGHRLQARPPRTHRHRRRRRRRLPVRQPGRVPPRDGDARHSGADGRLREP